MARTFSVSEKIPFRPGSSYQPGLKVTLSSRLVAGTGTEGSFVPVPATNRDKRPAFNLSSPPILLSFSHSRNRLRTWTANRTDAGRLPNFPAAALLLIALRRPPSSSPLAGRRSLGRPAFPRTRPELLPISAGRSTAASPSPPPAVLSTDLLVSRGSSPYPFPLPLAFGRHTHHAPLTAAASHGRRSSSGDHMVQAPPPRVLAPPARLTRPS